MTLLALGALATVPPIFALAPDASGLVVDPAQFGWDVAAALIGFLLLVSLPLIGLALLSLVGKW